MRSRWPNHKEEEILTLSDEQLRKEIGFIEKRVRQIQVVMIVSFALLAILMLTTMKTFDPSSYLGFLAASGLGMILPFMLL
jgi:hypothetical protein